MEESYGLIVDSSGTRYKTKYDKDDSDDDGLKDNEEISNNGWCEKEGTDHFGKPVYKRFYHMRSNPLKQDSDGDGINDKDDTLPLDYSSKYGSIYYENKKKNIASWYYIEIPNHIDTQYEGNWEFEDEVIKSDYDMTCIKYLSGIAPINTIEYVPKNDYEPVPQILDLDKKSINTLSGLGFFAGFLCNAENLAEDFSIRYRFEKYGDMHRVIISAGSKSTRDLYNCYATDQENSLYRNQNRNPFGEYEVSKAVMNLYKKIKGKSLPNGNYDLRVTCDSKHKGEKYTSYLWINKDGKIMEKPKLYANDKVSIGRINGRIIQDYEKILDIKIGGSVEASEMYQNLFKRIEYKDVRNGTIN